MSRSEDPVIVRAEILALSDEERVEMLVDELICLRNFVNTHEHGLYMLRSFAAQHHFIYHQMLHQFDARGMLEDRPSE